MAIVRVVCPGEWEVVTSTNPIVGSQSEVLARLLRKRLRAEIIAGEIHVLVEPHHPGDEDPRC